MLQLRKAKRSYKTKPTSRKGKEGYVISNSRSTHTHNATLGFQQRTVATVTLWGKKIRIPLKALKKKRNP